MTGNREENAIVVEYLASGKAGEAQKEPVAQLIGESQFTLLEVVPKPGVALAVGEKVYIGSGPRDKIDHIRGRIAFAEMTNRGQQECRVVVAKIVKAREADFVRFFNTAGPINIRAHYLEQIPSVGKKHLQAILDARDKKAFESFEDIQARVPHLTNVEHLVVERIIEELSNVETRYYLFTKPPAREEPVEERRYRR